MDDFGGFGLDDFGGFGLDESDFDGTDLGNDLGLDVSSAGSVDLVNFEFGVLNLGAFDFKDLGLGINFGINLAVEDLDLVDDLGFGCDAWTDNDLGVESLGIFGLSIADLELEDFGVGDLGAGDSVVEGLRIFDVGLSVGNSDRDGLGFDSLCFDALCFDDLCFDGLCVDRLCFDELCFEDLCFEDLEALDFFWSRGGN